MSTQDVENKRGEIEFRRKLFQQQVEGESIFTDEFDAAGIESVLRERMDETEAAMRRLVDAGVRISPYLEIGAERGQRALVLENRLGIEGAALDLSLDLLRSCAHYARRFDQPKLPLRICADAYRLPFRSGSLPFVFCYQTLHHFPSLEPVVAEIHRVLAPGGHFFFAEEPYRRVLHLNLVRARGGVRTAPRSRLAKLLRNLFVEESFNEEDFGVIENHDMSVAEWRRAMTIFAAGRSTLELDRFRVNASGPRNPFLYLLLVLLGGRIGGLYRKAGTPTGAVDSIRDALVSPESRGTAREEPLEGTPAGFVAADGTTFETVDGVAMLMARETRGELYPELTRS